MKKIFFLLIFIILFMFYLFQPKHDNIYSFLEEFPVLFDDFLEKKTKSFNSNEKKYFLSNFNCSFSNLDYDIIKNSSIDNIIPIHFNNCLIKFEQYGNINYHKKLIEKYELYEEIK